MIRLQKFLIPVVALVVGLGIGLGVGHLQVQKEQRVSQEKIKEAGRKVAYIQNRAVEQKNEAISYAEQKCQGDLDILADEKQVLGGQLEKAKAQNRTVEEKLKEADKLATRLKKELQEVELKYTQADRHGQELEREREKMTAEKAAAAEMIQKLENAGRIAKAENEKREKAREAELQKTSRNLGVCETNNASLSIIAEELVHAYRNKGVSSAILEKEPLTQIRKVELEKLTQNYRQQIEQQKIRKK